MKKLKVIIGTGLVALAILGGLCANQTDTSHSSRLLKTNVEALASGESEGTCCSRTSYTCSIGSHNLIHYESKGGSGWGPC